MKQIYKGLQLQTNFNPYRLAAWREFTNIIPEKTRLELYELIKQSKDNKLTDNSIVYRSPLSTLPPYKLKSYIEDNKLNIQTARKWDKIDTIIIDDTFINQYFNQTRYDWKSGKYETIKSKNHMIVPISAIIYDSKFSKHLPDQKRTPIENLTYLPDSDKCTHFIIEEEDFKEMTSTDPKFLSLRDVAEIKTGVLVVKEHGSKPLTDNCGFLIDLVDKVKQYNIKVVLDSSVNSAINEGLVIDFDVFTNLYSMLNSSDTGNWEVAKEIIANCEFETSKAYIIFLYNACPELRKSTQNKNYKIVQKILDNSKLNINLSARYGTPSFDSLVSFFGDKCPQLLPEMMPCLVHHLNTISKTNLIKEIVFH